MLPVPVDLHLELFTPICVLDKRMHTDAEERSVAYFSICFLRLLAFSDFTLYNRRRRRKQTSRSNILPPRNPVNLSKRCLLSDLRSAGAILFSNVIFSRSILVFRKLEKVVIGVAASDRSKPVDH